ncbi:MAG: DUF4493 domain-containing protein [Bacteroidales bacterium]|nr:DUF4493 domain-containing protein [Bacteroidales bacterium]
MKRITASILVIASGLILTTSCDKKLEGGMGELSLEVLMSNETRAAMSESETLASAKVKIYKADFSGLVREYVKSEMPASLYLPADSYRVDVEAGELSKENPAKASWDQASWKGSSNVNITASTTSSVSVTAKICNAISRINFDPSIAAAFENDYVCTVGLSKDNPSEQLGYTSSKNGAEGYFIADGFEPSLWWTFTGTLKKNGESFTRSGEIPAVEGGKRYTLGFKYTDTEGLLNFSVLVDDSVNTKYDNITFIATTTGLAEMSRYDIWAGHFDVSADVDEAEYDAARTYIEYRAANTGSWIRVPADRESEGSFRKSITGLTPDTEYEYRLIVTSSESGEEEIIDATSTVRTEKAYMIPNPSFETTSNTESSKYKSLYDPSSSDASLQTKWWDSGNSGSTLVGSSAVICYPDTQNKMDGNQSMCLQSRYVVIKFAAGNLFSGHFGELQGTTGGTVYFGRPFTGRPTGIRFWAKYAGGKVNRTGDAPSSLIKNGDYDRAEIKVILGTWDYKKYGGDADSPVLVNTTDKSTFVDYPNDPATIGYAQKILMSDASNSNNVWQQITLPIDYKTTTKYPTHIIVSCAASMFGDYFTGYDDSHLWVDGFELLYE